MAMELLGSVDVTVSGTSNITFNSIPQDGKELLLMVAARNNSSGGFSNILRLSYNGNTGSTSDTVIDANSTSVGVGFNDTNAHYLNRGESDSGFQSGVFGVRIIRISNYATGNAPVLNRGAVSNNTNTPYYIVGGAHTYYGSPISSLSVFFAANSFEAGSSASLYKIF